MSLMPLQFYKDTLFGDWELVQGVVEDKDCFYLNYYGLPDGSEENSDIDPDYLPKRLVAFFRDEPLESQWYFGQVIGFPYLISGFSELPDNESVYVSMEGGVVTSEGVENKIPSGKQGPKRGAIKRLRTIDGYLYFCGGNRSVGKRLGRNQWENLCINLPKDTHKSAYLTMGFKDIDGFAADDIYCAGGQADVWHYNGATWRQIQLPTNIDLESLVCAGDGQVYISGEQGLTFVGRGDHWQAIPNTVNSMLPFKDMVWYEDRVWCTNSHGTWTIYKDRFNRYQMEKQSLPGKMHVYSGSLSARDGVLLLAGPNGAAFLENGQWTVIYNRIKMDMAVLDKN